LRLTHLVSAGLDPAIHRFDQQKLFSIDARVNPRIKSGDAHDG